MADNMHTKGANTDDHIADGHRPARKAEQLDVYR